MTAPTSGVWPPEPQPHAVCHASAAQARAEFAQALRDRDARATADERIGRAIRRLTLPGVKRRTIRLDELRGIIEELDRPW